VSQKFTKAILIVLHFEFNSAFLLCDVDCRWRPAS